MILLFTHTEINISKIGQKYVGYSIADRGGIFETKTSLKIQKRKNTIYIEEDRILYTKADYSTFDDFCLMSFETNDTELFNKKRFKSSFIILKISLNEILISFIMNEFI